MPAPQSPVILYDGVCGLCNRLIQIVLKWERREEFLFAALQSLKGQELLAQHGILALNPQAAPDSVVLIDGGRVYIKSEAALRIVARLRWPWAALTFLRLAPRGARDAVYDWVARHRYAIFGKLDACPLPDPHTRPRFME